MLIIIMVLSIIFIPFCIVNFCDHITLPFGKYHIKKWILRLLVSILLLGASIAGIILCSSSTLVDTTTSQFVIKQNDINEYILQIDNEHVIFLTEDDELKKVPLSSTKIIETADSPYIVETKYTYERNCPKIIRRILIFFNSSDIFTKESYVLYINTDYIN